MRFLLVTILLILALAAGAIATEFQLVNVASNEQAEMRGVLDRATARLEQLLEMKLPPVVTVVLIETQAQYDSVAGGELPEWGAAAAIPRRNLIVLREPLMDNYPGNRANLLQHELAHIAMQHRVKFHRLPRFIEEGFAAWFAGEWGLQNLYAVSGAQFTKSLLPLRQIDNVNSFKHPEARLAYSQSYLVIHFMFEKHGEFSWLEYLDYTAQGLSLEEAWRSSFHQAFWEFETDYKKFLSDNYSITAILSNMTGLWIILAIMVIAGFIVIKQRKKHVIERWKEEEKYQSTDFDYDQDDSPWD